MSTKLTLTLDKRVIEQAKKYAKDQGRSLSNLIEEYLRKIITEDPLAKEEALPPIVKSLKGAVKITDQDFDYKKILEEELIKKYTQD